MLELHLFVDQSLHTIVFNLKRLRHNVWMKRICNGGVFTKAGGRLGGLTGIGVMHLEVQWGHSSELELT